MIFLAENLRFLRKKHKQTQDTLAVSLNIGRSNIANWEAKVAVPDLNTAQTIANHFGISIDALVSKELSKQDYTPDQNDEFLPNIDEVDQKGGFGNRQNVSPIVSPIVSPTRKTSKKAVQFMPQVITVDNSGNENILYVPVQARAGYLVGHGDPKYLQTLPAFSIPGLRNATYRMFDITGVSMAPTITDGDKVIAEYVSSLDDIIDGRIYVVVTTAGIVVKRLLNRTWQRGKVVLKSDTIAHRSEFKTYEITPEEIIELWYCRLKLSADFSEPSEIYSRMNDLESDVVELKTLNNNLLFDLEEIKQIVHSKLK